jgi:hypothetical protein
LFTLLFLERIPFRDSILIALDPGSFPPLPKTFVELPGLSNIFLFELDYSNP